MSLTFGIETTEAVPDAGPGRIPLKRRVSAPEPANLDSILGNTEDTYAVGNIIRLQLQEATTRTKRTVRVEIVKTFSPFTMAPVMVVRICEPTLNLKGDFVLKTYDRRYVNNLRMTERDVWSRARDMEFEKRRWSKEFVKFFLKSLASEYLGYTGESDEEVDDDEKSHEEDQNELDAYDELYFEVFCLRMYSAELEVYRRARKHGIDGIHVPRFISSVRIPPSYHSKHCQYHGASIKGRPGMLMQYIPGFSLIDLYYEESPVPARSDWQYIVDDGLGIVHYYMQHMDMRNEDDNLARNTVVHWDPITQKWKCKLIDFGHCLFREEGMSDWDWRKCQAWIDEETCIGRHMQTFLKKRKDFDYEYDMSQYWWDLTRDFRM
jgi:hypothetical protein